MTRKNYVVGTDENPSNERERLFFMRADAPAVVTKNFFCLHTRTLTVRLTVSRGDGGVMNRIHAEVPAPDPKSPPTPTPSPDLPEPGPEPPFPTPERPPLTDPEPPPAPIGDPTGLPPVPQALI